MENVTLWMSFLTTPLIQKSHQTVESPNSSSHINSRSREENHLNKAARNATSDHPYPSQPKHWSLTSQSRTRMINAHLLLGFCQHSMKL
jgi:hypothetical protein